jgi:hypothetical protein
MISFEINNAFFTGSLCEMVWKKSQGKKVQKKHKVSQHSQLFNCKEHGTRNLVHLWMQQALKIVEFIHNVQVNCHMITKPKNKK